MKSAYGAGIRLLVTGGADSSSSFYLRSTPDYYEQYRSSRWPVVLRIYLADEPRDRGLPLFARKPPSSETGFLQFFHRNSGSVRSILGSVSVARSISLITERRIRYASSNCGGKWWSQCSPFARICRIRVCTAPLRKNKRYVAFNSLAAVNALTGASNCNLRDCPLFAAEVKPIAPREHVPELGCKADFNELTDRYSYDNSALIFDTVADYSQTGSGTSFLVDFHADA